MKITRRFLRGLRRHVIGAAALTTVAAVLAGLSPKQRAFVQDESPRLAALCGRQGGKSHSVGAWLIIRGLQAPAGTESVFIALSRSSARRIIGGALRKIAKQAGIEIRQENEDGQLYFVLPNGHRIWVAGCPHVGEIDKFRGLQFWSVAIDECGFMAGFLEELVDGALDATLLAYQGRIALTSSPGVVPVGYFYDVTTESPGWSRHQWTVLDNPAIPHAVAWLQERMERFRWNAETPIYVREWLGRWVNDQAGLVYPLFKAVNLWDGVLPEGDVETVIGVDVGFRDAMGFVVVSTVRGTGKKFIRHAEKQEGMTPNAVVARVQQLLGQFPRALVVVDEGGAGKGYAVHLREEGVGCVAADKTQKRANQEWLAGEMLCGNVLVDWEKCRALTDEALVLRWGGDGKEDPRFPNHACDAALYACRAIRVTYGTHGPALPAPGTPAYEDYRAKEYKKVREREMRDLAKRRGRSLGLRIAAHLCQIVSRETTRLAAWLVSALGTRRPAPTALKPFRPWGARSSTSSRTACFATA